MKYTYICDYVRTPIGRYGGALSSIRADDLASLPLKALCERYPHLDWSAVDDVILGCANQAGEDNRNIARMALLLAGMPEAVPGQTVNRLCGSGMDAVINAARTISSGEADLVIAGGVESMSRAPFVLLKSEKPFSRSAHICDTTIGWRFVNPQIKAHYGVESMPETAENVAEEFGISRDDQDAFAMQSQERADRAQNSGRLALEIEPVSINPEKGSRVLVSSDEHPRANTTLQKLSLLPAPFRERGTVTAGNSSGVNDGAAALLMASEAGVSRHGLTPLARIIGGAHAGVAPRIMGVAPVPAIRKLCHRLDLKISNFDVIEVNEAFAAQALAVLRELRVSDLAKHVNPNGGAIALGHPLGATGARLVGTAAVELRERRGRLALATMCVGVGQGIALALEAVECGPATAKQPYWRNKV